MVSVRFSGENKSHWSSLEFPNLDWSMSFKLRQLDSVYRKNVLSALHSGSELKDDNAASESTFQLASSWLDLASIITIFAKA